MVTYCGVNPVISMLTFPAASIATSFCSPLWLQVNITLSFDSDNTVSYTHLQKPVPAIAQNEQQQHSPLPKNTATPKATWVQANHSVVPLYENQREINGSHINNGEIRRWTIGHRKR